MTTRYSGNLKIGDFIIISNNNYLSLGFYAGSGRGTLQYYWLDGLSRRYDLMMKGEKLEKKLYKFYLNSPRETRTIKYDVNLIENEETIEKYHQSIEILKKYNII